jgi:8-oxo-dGTP pyrophosphatase MutT (NUDIX family)/cell division septation protein DedD
MGSEAGFFSSDPQRGAGGGPSPRTTSHAVESSYRTACAVIVKDEKYVLLGRADPEVTDDDRGGLWCFPGGGIDPEDGGDVSLSAEREAFEEAGVKVRPTGTIIDHPESPGVAFVICTYLEGEPTPNAEFSQLSWVPWAMRHEWEGIYPVNLSVLERIPPGMISEDYRSDVARIRYQDESFEDELSRGIEVEREHTDDPKVARKIALDHLREDPEYYTKLKAAGIKGESIRVWTSRFRSILEKAQKLSQKASSVGKHQVTGGVGAEPDARALPGTSLKAPEKQKQIDGGIKKQDTEFTRSKTLSDPGEEGGARSVEKARELQGREPSGQAPSQTQTQGAAGKPPQAPQTGQNAGEAPQQAPQQALLPQAEKTVDLAFPSKDQADRAFQWLRALGLDYVTADGTKIRVQVQSQEEMALVNRTAQAFGLSLSSLAA